MMSRFAPECAALRAFAVDGDGPQLRQTKRPRLLCRSALGNPITARLSYKWGVVEHPEPHHPTHSSHFLIVVMSTLLSSFTFCSASSLSGFPAPFFRSRPSLLSKSRKGESSA